MTVPSYLEPAVREDLEHKMVFVACPRQVGTTKVARQILAVSDASVYLNRASRGGPPVPLAEPGRELELRAGPADALDALMRFGGFPEPFLAQSTRTHRRWQKERLERVLREDVRDLEAVRDLSPLQLLADVLPERAASPLSLNALRDDLEVSHRALTHWIDILERLYYVVRLRPFEHARVRSLRKMPKAYMWDWSEVAAPGPRFENLVALHLLNFCHFLQDREGHRADLWYPRDRAGREVDFLVTANRKPWFAVEAKLAETAIDPSLVYFRDRLRIPFAYQVVLEARRDFVQRGVRCMTDGWGGASLGRQGSQLRPVV